MDSQEDDLSRDDGSRNNWCLSLITRYGEQIGVCGFDSWTTIAEVKALVADTTDLGAEQQRLIFAGTELDDNRTLESYGITDGSTLRQEALHWALGGINLQAKIVFVPLVPRCVRVVGPSLTLRWVHPIHTIGWVKKAIEANTKYHADDQRLLRDGVYQLEDDRTMVSYGLTYDTEIICELPDDKDHALKGQAGAGTPLRDSTPPPRGRASLSLFEV